MDADAILLDSSVWIASGSPKERFAAASLAVVLDTDRDVGTLDLVFYEIANVFGSRRGDYGSAGRLCRSVELRCGDKVVRVDPTLMEAAGGIAREHGLTSYGAAYVAAARRYGWQLVSTDIEDLVSRGFAITPDAAV
jgi:predicted nucleic acid-binding protein